MVSQLLFWEPGVITEFEDRQRWSRGIVASYLTAYGMFVGVGVEMYHLRKFWYDPSHRPTLKRWFTINLGLSLAFFIA